MEELLDIEDQNYKLYLFSCDTRDLDYFYIDYQMQPGQLF